MALLNFPTTPTNGQRYPATGNIGGVYYVWDSVSTSWRAYGSGPFTTKGEVLTYDGLYNTAVSPGTNGQILSVNSSTANGLEWIDLPEAGFNSPLTTKGDILTYDTDNARLPVGTEGQILSVNSSTANGLEWIDLPEAGFNSPLTTKGDLLTYDTDNARLPVGTDGYVLSANSSTATGLEWVEGGNPYQEFITVPNQILYRPLPTHSEKWLIIQASNTLCTLIELRDTELASVPVGWQFILDNLGPNEVQIAASGPSWQIVAEYSYVPPNYGSVHIVRQTATNWRIVGDLIDATP